MGFFDMFKKNKDLPIFDENGFHRSSIAKAAAEIAASEEAKERARHDPEFKRALDQYNEFTNHSK